MYSKKDIQKITSLVKKKSYTSVGKNEENARSSTDSEIIA
jgi:hypothetical protein